MERVKAEINLSKEEMMLFDLIKAHKVAQGSFLQNYYGEKLIMKNEWDFDFSKSENYGIII